MSLFSIRVRELYSNWGLIGATLVFYIIVSYHVLYSCHWSPTTSIWLMVLSTVLFQVAVDGTSYHKACFRCTHGGCVISPSNYVAHEHRLYCRHHHTQLFKQKGNFSQLDKQENVDFSQLDKQENVEFSQLDKQENVEGVTEITTTE